MAQASDERTPLMSSLGTWHSPVLGSPDGSFEKRDYNPTRKATWEFLEARTSGGRVYEWFTVSLIIANCAAFVVGSLFNEQWNVDGGGTYLGPACDWCDFYFFGNVAQVTILEVSSVAVFSLDYLLRLWSVVESESYGHSRVAYMMSLFSLVDLVSIIPFFIELATPANLPATQFFRIFRLFRMMRGEGRYMEAFGLFDDVFYNNATLLRTAAFVGGVVWLVASGLYYVAERRNLDMIYCPVCPDVDTSKCSIDKWGVASCAAAGCTGECWNLFQSIPGALYFTLLNLFGEFPLTGRQGPWGKVVAVLVAVCAVFVFGIPTGIFGNGFSELMDKKRAEREAAASAGVTAADAPPSANQASGDDFTAGDSSLRESIYNFIENKTQAGVNFDRFTSVLIVLSTLTFMVETTAYAKSQSTIKHVLTVFEVFTVCVFSVEYVLRLYAIGVNPKYSGLGGMCRHLASFFNIVDFSSIAPFWISAIFLGGLGAGSSSTFVRSFRLMRMFKTEGIRKAFSVFEDVIKAQADVLVVTGFAAAIFWLFFSCGMYFLERNNPDTATAGYYRTIPGSMWVTLLNLSGECPLCFYTTGGKITTAIIGVFAVGFFGIPVGVLGAGFQDWVQDHQEDTPDADDGSAEATELIASPPESSELSFRQRVALFVDGETPMGRIFELLILLFIFLTIIVAAIETLPSLNCQEASAAPTCATLDSMEAVAAVIFTLEYLARLYSAESRFGYIFSFYSIIDLLSVVPWYIAMTSPGGWVDDNSNLFLMLRIMRLFKLDKYIPSLSLIDDVFRLKRHSLVVTGIVALILWVLFGSLMFMSEENDTANSIDPIPYAGCSGNCTQSDRYYNAFAAMPFTLIHLTGDYPIIDYTWTGCVVCFFMVIAGAGIVSLPTAVIADGFSQVVEKRNGESSSDGSYEKLYAQTSPDAPREFSSDALDMIQGKINDFLNGALVPVRYGNAARRERSTASSVFNGLLVLLILANVFAVVLETIPEIDAQVGNTPGNFFDVFEAISVGLFTAEYVLRLFSVPKDREHLYSRWYYATTFFGVVDLLTILPWYIQECMLYAGHANQDVAAVFRLFRLFRLMQLEHFITAFTILDNVFRKSMNVFVATGVMALAIMVSSAALFYLFERNNPNWCGKWKEPQCSSNWTESCTCLEQKAFSSMPDALFYVAIFLCGEWAMVDFTIPGQLLCIALCIVGIAIYAIPVGTLFDSFGTVLQDGIGALDDKDEEGDP